MFRHAERQVKAIHLLHHCRPRLQFCEHGICILKGSRVTQMFLHRPTQESLWASTGIGIARCSHRQEVRPSRHLTFLIGVQQAPTAFCLLGDALMQVLRSEISLKESLEWLVCLGHPKAGIGNVQLLAGMQGPLNESLGLCTTVLEPCGST